MKIFSMFISGTHYFNAGNDVVLTQTRQLMTSFPNLSKMTHFISHRMIKNVMIYEKLTIFYSELIFNKLQMLFVFASIVGIGGGFVYEGML